MSASLLRNIHQNARAWMFAISAALAVHLVLFTIFVPIKFDSMDVSESPHTQIMMLPLKPKDSNTRIDDLIAWMKNDDPRLIISPASRFGYASMMEPGFPAPQNISDYKTKLLAQVIFLSSMQVPEIPVNNNTIKDCFDFFTTVHSYTFFAIKSSVIGKDNAMRYPYVEDLYQGFSLPVTFFNLGNENSLVTKYNPSSPTVLKMHYPDDKSLLPSGRVIESCGVRELDKIGLNTIVVQKVPEYLNNKLTGKDVYLRIDWRAPYTNPEKTEDTK